MSQVHLRSYDNSWYHPGRSAFWRASWFFLGSPLFRSHLLPSSSLRVHLLRLFGARIGQRVVIRHDVSIKYPWHLTIANDCWIGERVWIDCLTSVLIGNNACISQGAYLCTGNHNWSDPAFGLMIAPIQLNDGAWAGAMSILTPGTVLGTGAVAAAGSVISGTVPDFEIYAGNPAVFLKKRVLRSATAAEPQFQEEVR